MNGLQREKRNEKIVLIILFLLVVIGIIIEIPPKQIIGFVSSFILVGIIGLFGLVSVFSEK